MSVDLLLWALVDAVLEHMVSASLELRNARMVESESTDWISELGAWRMTWWR